MFTQFLLSQVNCNTLKINNLNNYLQNNLDGIVFPLD